MTPANSMLQIIQELRGAPLTVLVAMLVLGQSVQSGSLAKTCGFSRPTIRTALRGLHDRGFVVQDPLGGWGLTEAARDFLSGQLAPSRTESGQHAGDDPLLQAEGRQPNPAPIFQPVYQNVSWIVGEWPSSWQQPLGAGKNSSLPGEKPVGSGINFLPAEKSKKPDGKNISSRLENNLPLTLKSQKIKNLSSEILEKDLKINLKSKGLSLNLTVPDKQENYSSAEKNFHPQMPSGPEIEVGRVLSATSWLFGERVSGRPEQYPDARLLLGTIAAAYDHRAQLRTPARVVYANLKAGRGPEEKYLRRPQSFLPEEFCRMAGLPVSEEIEPEVEWPLVEPEALEWFRRLISYGIDLFGWTIHHKYLEECDLVRCDLEAGLFVLSAEDQLSADWMNARLIYKLQNILETISGHRLNVRFEVWPPPAEAA